MKLLRYGPPGQEAPGYLDEDGALRDLSGVVDDIGPATVSRESLERIRAAARGVLPLVSGQPRIGACLADTPNFYCIGLNYADAAMEAGVAPPEEPVLFSKATSSLSGPHDPIWAPAGAEKLDWEVELGVVIGREADHVTEGAALDYVAGYCLVNDVSERSFQGERGGQWIKGKSAPSFGKIGPYLVTADALENPQDIGLWLDVDGERMQESATSEMIFGVADIISYVSRFLTLRVGDLIATGAPAGVGMRKTPPRYLRLGNVVSLGADGLGEQRSVVIERP